MTACQRTYARLAIKWINGVWFPEDKKTWYAVSRLRKTPHSLRTLRNFDFFPLSWHMIFSPCSLVLIRTYGRGWMSCESVNGRTYLCFCCSPTFSPFGQGNVSWISLSSLPHTQSHLSLCPHQAWGQGRCFSLPLAIFPASLFYILAFDLSLPFKRALLQREKEREREGRTLSQASKQ